MRTLKTPEETYQEFELKFGRNLTEREIHLLIIAAQRDTLECVKDEFRSVSNNIIVLQGYSNDLNVVTAFHKFKSFLTNLMPKDK